LIHILQGQGTTAAAKTDGYTADTPTPKSATRAPAPARAAQPAPEAEADDSSDEPEAHAAPTPSAHPRSKQKYERPARTGREPGKTPVFFNIGRKQLVTPADLVGKIAGVTCLPASIVGAIDIHQRHSIVDVSTEHVALVLSKLAGIRLKSQKLEPTLAKTEESGAEPAE
ncbi:MAG TPA: DbpA RNA binding domain-containing protein, partial [Opitutaceae bacterium]|nr:DbpA RNA binding domain-containing protein [Opitutaceae bacterium]